MGGERALGQSMLQLAGLPSSTATASLLGFFHTRALPFRAAFIVLSTNGRPTGEAYVAVDIEHAQRLVGRWRFQGSNHLQSPVASRTHNPRVCAGSLLALPARLGGLTVHLSLAGSACAARRS